MGSQAIDYEAVIRDLERRRAEVNAQIDSTITGLRNVMAIREPQSHLPASLPLTQLSGLHLPYQGLTMIEAAMAHLRAVGRPVPNMVLAKAVEDGGFIHKSKNFPNTLNSILWRRANNARDVRKVGNAWALKEASE